MRADNRRLEAAAQAATSGETASPQNQLTAIYATMDRAACRSRWAGQLSRPCGRGEKATMGRGIFKALFSASLAVILGARACSTHPKFGDQLFCSVQTPQGQETVKPVTKDNQPI